MDWERSPRRDEALYNQENNQETIPQDKVKDIKKIKPISITDPYSANHHNNDQITLFQESFWLWSRQSCWFYFNQGLFWGVVIALTAILSASFGVALAKVEVVENMINSVINRTSSTTQPVSKYDLTHPVNILLIEVEPDENEIIQFSQAFVGKSKTILLLQFDPQLNTANIVNIPNDSRVKIPGFGWGTIEDANKHGGTYLISQAVIQLLDGITIDRYIRATPATFQKLIASGKIALNHCDARVDDCSSHLEQISHQQAAIEIIRQRLNIPAYFGNFQTTLTKTQSNLDTNLSLPELMSIANFIKELESDDIKVDLVSGYVAGENIKLSSQKQAPQSTLIRPTSVESKYPDQINNLSDNDRSFKNRPVAVQNTTNSPELGMHFVNYLRDKNFQDVYLVEHIPLKLDKTKIIINQSQLVRAKHLKNIVGFGKLEPKSYSQQPLTIQIGEDARPLLLENPNY